MFYKVMFQHWSTQDTIRSVGIIVKYLMLTPMYPKPLTRSLTIYGCSAD